MPKGRSLQAWINIYEEKTGDRVTLPFGFRLMYLAERGFATMKPDVEGKMMIVYQVCGDGKFFRDTAELMAAAMGLEAVGTICTRAIEPYIRSFGWEIMVKYNKKGVKRYQCQDSIGRLIICTQKTVPDNPEEDPQYWVVHYLNKKATDSEVLAPTTIPKEMEDGDIVCLI